jgi:glycosyltransferase involved in cell wall biosynthesis
VFTSRLLAFNQAGGCRAAGVRPIDDLLRRPPFCAAAGIAGVQSQLVLSIHLAGDLVFRSKLSPFMGDKYAAAAVRFSFLRRLFQLVLRPSMAAKLTVLIPCKDERRNIRPCIESVQAIADEVLIADSGSTDGTLDIVNEIGGCRVIEREFVNFADFKNWAIPQAKHPWVLLVEADERVTPELAKEVRRVLDLAPRDKDGYWIDRANHFLGHRIRHCGWNSDAVIRLFRRECRYRTGGINIEHTEVELPPARVGRLKHPLMHYTTWSTDHYLKKNIRYAHSGALHFQERGRRPGALAMLTRAPLRFLQLYFLRLGFLDGMPGFQVCMHTAYYSFLKQAKYWEMHYGLAQPDPEADRGLAADDQERILSFAQPQTAGEKPEVKQRRRAA